MYRTLLVLLFFAAGFVGCKKSTDPNIAYRAQAAIDDKVISDYLAANPDLSAKRVDYAAGDTSGVFFIIKTGEEGSGNDLFTTSTLVTVGYTGRLLTTEAVFAETGNIHPSFTLGNVIKGWQLGIPLLKKGGIIRLLIPSRYAYGPYAQAQIGLPANAVLDFDIELYNVTN